MIPRCTCGNALIIERVTEQETAWHCWCPACRKRAAAGEGDGHVVDLDGYGISRSGALQDFKERLKAT